MRNKNSRRTFIKTIIGTTTAAAVLNNESPLAQVNKPEKTAQTNQHSGYHETQHIRNYYNKINF